MLCCMQQAQEEHWRMLAEERGITIDALRTELQHAQVVAPYMVRMCRSKT